MAEPGAEGSRGRLRDFFLACLLWLPTAFLAWYWLAPAIQLGAWLVADLARRWFLAGLIAAIEVDGRLFEVVTRIPVAAERPEAVLTFAVDPLVYSAGMPLFAGLTLASAGPFTALLARLAIGLAALVPVQAFGVLMTILKTIGFDLAAKSAVTLAWSATTREAIALGYQLGSLILPGVAALVAWALLNRRFVAELTGTPALGPPPME